jgi:hypothetical protein
MIAQSGGDPHRLAELIIASGGLNNASMLNALHAHLGTQNALRVTNEVLRLQNRSALVQTSPAEVNATPAGAPSTPAGANATAAAGTNATADANAAANATTTATAAPQTQAPTRAPQTQATSAPTTAAPTSAPQTQATAPTTPAPTTAPQTQAPTADTATTSGPTTAPTSGGVSTEPIDRVVLGVSIHAPAGVRPGAVEQVASIIQTEIGRNPGAQEQLARKHVSVVIIPAHVAMTDLPEFQSLRGKKTFDGRAWEGVRGEGGTRYRGHFNIAVAEETVVNTDVASAYPATYSVAMHEFAHALNNYGMTHSQRSRVRELFQAHQRHDRGNANGTWTDTYASSDSDEYFAQATNAFFGRNGMGTNRNGRDALRETDPNMYQFLVTLYEAPDVNTANVATVA